MKNHLIHPRNLVLVAVFISLLINLGPLVISPVEAQGSCTVRFIARYVSGDYVLRNVFYYLDGGAQNRLGTVLRQGDFTFTVNFLRSIRVHVNVNPGTIYYEELYINGNLVASGNVGDEGLTYTISRSSCSIPSGSFCGEYYNNRSLGGNPAFTRNDSSINFDWGHNSPGRGVSSDDFSVRWQGRFTLSGNVTFIAIADDGIRVWVDNNLVIDAWRDQPPTEYRATRDLSSGEHTIKVEFYEHGGGAVAKLRWEQTAPPPGFPLDPGIARVSNMACSPTDTYFILSLSGQEIPNYYYYEVVVEAYGDAKVAQVMPVVGSQVASRIGEKVIIKLGETVLRISGIDTVVDLIQIFADEWDRQRRTDVRSFRVSWYDTAARPSLKFLIWGTHSDSGGIFITTRWQRSRNETISQSGSAPVCP